jgi:hypothetical protein
MITAFTQRDSIRQAPANAHPIIAFLLGPIDAFSQPFYRPLMNCDRSPRRSALSYAVHWIEKKNRAVVSGQVYKPRLRSGSPRGLLRRTSIGHRTESGPAGGKD